MSSRIVEVFTGAYASGKSESAINRALQHVERGEKITLVDLDTVEPVYCIRPITEDLKALGVNVISNTENFGLGETGSYVTGAQLNCLSNEGDIIIDVGYGAGGLDTLDVIRGIEKEENLKIYLIVNTSKFETRDVESILEYVDFSAGLNKRDWKKFSGFVSNTHFADETTKEDIIRGYEILKEASKRLDIPVIAIGADEKFRDDFKYDLQGDIQGQSYDGIPVWLYHRYMPKAFW